MTIDPTAHAAQLARLDPQSRAALDVLLQTLPNGLQGIPIPERRQAFNAFIEASAAAYPEVPNVEMEERTIPSLDGASEIQARVYRPTGASAKRPALYYIHGGGMVVGSLDVGAYACRVFATELQAVVVNINYRLAPEHPYPAAVEDCYAGLVWMGENADALGIDTDRIAIYGESAGGGLTVATTLLTMDRNGPSPCYVMAIYPMLDDRHETPSSHQITALGVWDRDASVEAWAAYLNGAEADGYAAPARRTDVKGFPSTFIDVGTEDTFRDEDIAFASKLMAAGTPTELHVNPGAFHSSELMAPTSPLNQRIVERRLAALKENLSANA
ncbi:MAG: alpha/beta hydrolase [Myxococcota bacterium]